MCFYTRCKWRVHKQIYEYRGRNIGRVPQTEDLFYTYANGGSHGMHQAGKRDRERQNYREVWKCADVWICSTALLLPEKWPVLIFKHLYKQKTQMKTLGGGLRNETLTILTLTKTTASNSWTSFISGHDTRWINKEWNMLERFNVHLGSRLVTHLETRWLLVDVKAINTCRSFIKLACSFHRVWTNSVQT